MVTLSKLLPLQLIQSNNDLSAACEKYPTPLHNLKVAKQVRCYCSEKIAKVVGKAVETRYNVS